MEGLHRLVMMVMMMFCRCYGHDDVLQVKLNVQIAHRQDGFCRLWGGEGGEGDNCKSKDMINKNHCTNRSTATLTQSRQVICQQEHCRGQNWCWRTSHCRSWSDWLLCQLAGVHWQVELGCTLHGTTGWWSGHPCSPTFKEHHTCDHMRAIKHVH